MLLIKVSPSMRQVTSRKSPGWGRDSVGDVAIGGIIITPNMMRLEADRADAFIRPLLKRWQAVADKYPDDFHAFAEFYKAWNALYHSVKDEWFGAVWGSTYEMILNHETQANEWAKRLDVLTGSKTVMLNQGTLTFSTEDALKLITRFGLIVLAVLVLPPIFRLVR